MEWITEWRHLWFLEKIFMSLSTVAEFLNAHENYLKLRNNIYDNIYRINIFSELGEYSHCDCLL